MCSFMAKQSRVIQGRGGEGELIYWIESLKKITGKLLASLYTKMNNPKRKGRKQFHLIASKKNKILKNKLK